MCFDWVRVRVDEKKGDKKDGLRKKGHVAAAAGELGEELSARESWSLETGPCGARIGRKTAIPIGSGDARAKGEKAASWRRDELRPTFGGGPSLSKWILVSSPKKDSFARISRIHLALSL